MCGIAFAGTLKFFPQALEFYLLPVVTNGQLDPVLGIAERTLKLPITIIQPLLPKKSNANTNQTK